MTGPLYLGIDVFTESKLPGECHKNSEGYYMPMQLHRHCRLSNTVHQGLSGAEQRLCLCKIDVPGYGRWPGIEFDLHIYQRALI